MDVYRVYNLDDVSSVLETTPRIYKEKEIFKNNDYVKLKL